MMCGVAGALYVPQVGIINPGEMSPANSIEIAIWAAVGGRATLIGPIVGAFLVNGAKSWLTVTAPEYWLYFLGALFIAVTLFLPNGIVGLVKQTAPRKGGARHDARPDGRRRAARGGQSHVPRPPARPNRAAAPPASRASRRPAWWTSRTAASCTWKM
jgi:urea transport system permease protein